MKSNSIVNVRVAVRQRSRREPARGHLQGDAPRVVERRRLRERHLADDLQPQVQRRVGVLPGVVGEGRPALVRHGRIIARGPR